MLLDSHGLEPFAAFQVLANRRKERMGRSEVEVLDDLHVIGGNNEADVAKLAHLAAFETRQPNGHVPAFASHLEGLQNISGVAAPADREGYVARPHEIPELLSKDIFGRGIVRPSRHHWDVVGQSHRAKPLTRPVDRTFPQIAGKMGG